MTEPIKLPPEFRIDTGIHVERATITRERMVEILTEAIEADRKERGELAGWQFFDPSIQEWNTTYDPDWNIKCGREVRAVYTAPTTPEVQALREDSERLSFIENEGGADIVRLSSDEWEVSGNEEIYGTGHTLREAIDHARHINGKIRNE